MELRRNPNSEPTSGLEQTETRVEPALERLSSTLKTEAKHSRGSFLVTTIPACCDAYLPSFIFGTYVQRVLLCALIHIAISLKVQACHTGNSAAPPHSGMQVGCNYKTVKKFAAFSFDLVWRVSFIMWEARKTPPTTNSAFLFTPFALLIPLVVITCQQRDVFSKKSI